MYLPVISLGEAMIALDDAREHFVSMAVPKRFRG